MGLTGLAAVPSWFVVLPDCAAAGFIESQLRDYASQLIHHPSGRPWLLGRWAKDTVTVGHAGPNKIAALGQHSLSGGQLSEYAEHARTPSDIDRVTAELAGSSHVVASVSGQMRVQGTVTGIRRVLSAEINGITAASDRADVLAFLLDSDVDERRLAVHLLVPPFLHPLTDEPVWRNVAFLPTDCYLLVDDNGKSRQVRCWTPPEPKLSLAEGASALRAALTAAVDARTEGRALVSCDLSGLDSTSVCCLAARHSKVVAYTAASPDPLDDDVLWATRTAAALDRVEHHVIRHEEMPLIYHGLLGMNELLDEPCGSIADHARWLTIARRAAAHGSQLHLTGFGGDELLASSASHLRSLLRTRPTVALRQLNALAAKHRWRPRQALRQLADARSYRTWLMGAADRLTTPRQTEGGPALGWGPTPSLPPWVTSDAVSAVRELIRAEAPNSQPLATRRSQHSELEGVQYAARPVRQIAQLAARIGITLAAPYLDDHVLDASLAVRPEEKRSPWCYKPLTLAAMRGIVPAESLTRQTKSGGICDLNVALRSNRADLLALWEDSHLGRLGLIDAAWLRRLCMRPLDPKDPHDLHGGLYQTVAVEVWLRALDRATTRKAGVSP